MSICSMHHEISPFRRPGCHAGGAREGPLALRPALSRGLRFRSIFQERPTAYAGRSRFDSWRSCGARPFRPYSFASRAFARFASIVDAPIQQRTENKDILRRPGCHAEDSAKALWLCVPRFRAVCFWTKTMDDGLCGFQGAHTCGAHKGLLALRLHYTVPLRHCQRACARVVAARCVLCAKQCLSTGFRSGSAVAFRSSGL